MAKPASLIEALTLQMNPGMSLEELRQPGKSIAERWDPPLSKKSKQETKLARKASCKKIS